MTDSLINRRTDKAAFRNNNPVAIIAVIIIAFLGFQFNYIVVYALFGRGGGFGISLEFFTAMPLAIIGLIKLKSFLIRKEISLISITFFLFVFWILFGSILSPPSSVRNLLAPISLLLIISGSYFIFRVYWTKILKHLKWIILCTILLFYVFMIYQILVNQFNLNLLRIKNDIFIYKLLIGSFLSTDLSIIFSMQICYLIFLWKTGYFKKIIFACLLFNMLMIILCGSRGALLGIILIFILYIKRLTIKRKIALIFLILFVYWLAGSFISEHVFQPYTALFEKKYVDSFVSNQKETRILIYEELWRLAKKNPFFGIGLGQFENKGFVYTVEAKVPHQNLLGRACENGFPAMIFYGAFVVFVLMNLAKAMNKTRSDPNSNPYFRNAVFWIEACFMIFLYLQFRGLFTDTLAIKEQYFCVGAGLGTREWLNSRSALLLDKLTTKGDAR